MLEIERLDELFGLLEAMTQSQTSCPQSTQTPKIQGLLKWCMHGLLFYAFLILVLAAWQHLGTVHPGFYWIYWTPLIVLLILPGLAVWTNVSIILDQRRQRSPIMLAALKKDLHWDAKLLIQLWTFDKATLAYGLVQYRHRWLSLERRQAALARKPGLFGVIAILIALSAALLLEEKDSYLLPLSLGIAAVIFYVVAFDAFVSLERPKQVIELLEYAIQHADQSAQPHPIPITSASSAHERVA